MERTDLKIIKRNELDEIKYNDLLAKTSAASVYNHLDYIDYLADQSCFLVINDYKAVIALPFTKRLNSKKLTNPVFSRIQDWLGEVPCDLVVVRDFLRENFDRCDFSIGNIILDDESSKEMVTQYIEKNQLLRFNTQAKRNLKKIPEGSFTIEEMDKTEGLNYINQLLTFKIGGIRDIEVTRLNRLIHDFKGATIHVKGLKMEAEWLAVGVFLKWRSDYLYLKGTNTDLGKDFAAMQTLILSEIQLAQSQGLNFQFEGSNVESVARFNYSFGALDKKYYNWSWDDSKGIFAWIKKWM